MSWDILDKLSLRSIIRSRSDFNETTIDVDFMGVDQFSLSNDTTNYPYEIFQPLPAYSTVLGICEDGLPLVLDLNDPNPGAILISGRMHTGKTQLLRSILFSACSSNNAEKLYFYLITPDPGHHQDLKRFDQCYGIFSAYDKATCELIVEMSALVEQRKSGRHLGVKCLIAIENLYEFIKHQDFDVINHLKWLFRCGSSNGIWLVSTMEAERAKLLEPGLLKEQKTHIQSGSERWILPDTTSDHKLHTHLQSYRTMIGNEWVEFWLPSTNY